MTATSPRIAYITQTRKVCFLTVLPDARAPRWDGQRVDVGNKREARAYCAANGILPWNF